MFENIKAKFYSQKSNLNGRNFNTGFFLNLNPVGVF